MGLSCKFSLKPIHCLCTVTISNPYSVATPQRSAADGSHAKAERQFSIQLRAQATDQQLQSGKSMQTQYQNISSAGMISVFDAT